MCDTLVDYNIDLTEIVPQLATEWKVSDDGLTYTFTIRDDAKFQAGQYQEGRAVVAEDVKYSLERSATESAMNRLDMLDHCNVVDDHTVECVLKAPNASPLLRMPATSSSRRKRSRAGVTPSATTSWALVRSSSTSS